MKGEHAPARPRPIVSRPFAIRFSDGTSLAVQAGDAAAARVVAIMARAARLAPAPETPQAATRRLLVVTEGLCSTPAVASRDGDAFLLAGRSRVGKTTAASRLPRGWRSPADDATLVVREAGGPRRAHRWPTWSQAVGGERGGGRRSWAVRRCERPRAIFVLERGDEDRAEPLGPGHTVALLAELAQQTSRHHVTGLPPGDAAAFNLARFDDLCALAQAVPAYTPRVGREGSFWDEIERVVRRSRGGPERPTGRYG